MAAQFQVGDIITLDNVPGIEGQEWRVAEIVPGRGVKLVCAGDSAIDHFNNAAGEFWIVTDAE